MTLQKKLEKLKEKIEEAEQHGYFVGSHYFQDECVVVHLRMQGTYKLLVIQFTDFSASNCGQTLSWIDRELEDSDLAAGLESLIDEALEENPIVLGE